MPPNERERNDNDPEPRRVRRKYTPHACNECQRRKRKCSGDRICDSCRVLSTDCIYGRSRSHRGRELHHHSATNSSNSPQPGLGPTGTSFSHASYPGDDSALWTLQQNFQSLKDELARLKANSISLNTQPSLTTAQEPAPSSEIVADMTASAAPPSMNVMATSLPECSDIVQLSPEPALAFLATAAKMVEMEPAPVSKSGKPVETSSGASFFRQIELLDRSVNCDEDQMEQLEPEPSDETSGPDKRPELVTSVLWREADLVVEQTRSQDLDSIDHDVEIFFRHLHPHWPFINEIHFRSQLAAFWAKDTCNLIDATMPKFAALLSFVVAAVQVLYPKGENSSEVPGWNEFFRGERLLTYTTWLEEANIMTIQILLLKTLYCFFAGHFDTAYDTIGTAVRLCFQLGLHNEASWGAECTFYERTYRQRVFWSLFCLSPLVAHHAGVPDLMHKATFDVDYPKQVVDRMLYPKCLALQELPKASLVPNLLEVIKWARLSSEIWDLMYSVGAKKRLDQNVVIIMDEKVKALSTQAPSFLQWKTVIAEERRDHIPSFRWQQALVLYLRERSLRLFLRRYDMLSMQFSPQTAQTCIEITNEIIEAMELSRESPFAQRTTQYTLVLHITGAVVLMICIIFRPETDENLARPAIEAFNRSLRIIKEYAHEHSFSRRTLRRLDRPIRIASKTINCRWPQYAGTYELTPLSSHMATYTNAYMPGQMSSMVGDALSMGFPPQNQPWDHFGQMLPKFGGTMGLNSGIPDLTDESMQWDDLFDARNTIGI